MPMGDAWPKRMRVESRHCDLHVGEWQPLDTRVPACHDSRPPALRRDCSAHRLLQFRPRDCELPLLTNESFAAALSRRKLRFIGDSVTWDHFNYVGRCIMGCNSRLDQNSRHRRLTLKDARYQEAWRNELLAAGYSNFTADTAIFFMRLANAKEHVFEGCDTERGGHVDIRSLNYLPGSNTRDPDLMGAVLHGLLYIGFAGPSGHQLNSRSMGPGDIVVMNLGLHDKHRDLHKQIPMVLEWWKRERAAGRAPRLLWRQASPQHWNASMGKFRTFQDILNTAAGGADCQPPSASAADALPMYDQGVSDLVRHAGDFADVLPVFAATWLRPDEHPSLKYFELPAMSQKALAANRTYQDCTHWCSPGSVPRFWTQAIMRWLVSEVSDG